MKSTDSILTSLFLAGQPALSKDIPLRDRKILSSLNRQLASGHFLTENQGKLLVKIFKENVDHLRFHDSSIQELISNPVWSNSFRKIDQVRKIYISNEEEKKLVIEFSYNKRIREQLSKIVKETDGGLISSSNKKCSLMLTEKNVSIVMQAFKNFKFDIDEKILEFYKEIVDIIKDKKIPFDINNLENKNLLNDLTNDIGEENLKNHLILHDRKIRYQYTISQKISQNSLIEKIASREQSKIFLDKKDCSLTEIINSLEQLNRLPILFVFPGHDAKISKNMLSILSSSLRELNLDEHVGIFFRFDNTTDENKNFNELINHLQYNKNLTGATEIVGLSYNKLPKFIVKDRWKPKSIITFTNSFKSNKTSVYFDDVDLIIFYNDHPPLGEINAVM